MNVEFFLTSLIVVLLPGTGVIYTVSIGLLRGAKASIFAAFGCTAGILPSMIASIFGLSAIFNTSAVVFQSVKFIGVVYLLYIAWTMWRENGQTRLQNKEEGIGLLKIIFKGFLINILNPKLTLFFLAFLPQFIPSQTQTPVVDMLVLGGFFMALTLFVFILYGLFANSMRRYITSSSKYINKIQKTFAILFALLAVKLALAER
ncbi:MAG: LysE family translocator [Campylobacteraceae bacterium]|nr:LysE family translocator [Campylobacteraceae bacterium]